jgi:hypothetical protein
MWLNKYVDPSALFTGSNQSFDFIKILVSSSSCVLQMPDTQHWLSRFIPEILNMSSAGSSSC